MAQLFATIVLPLLLLQTPASPGPAIPQESAVATHAAPTNSEEAQRNAVSEPDPNVQLSPEAEREIERQVEKSLGEFGSKVNPSEWWWHGLLAMLTPFAFFLVLALIALLLYRRSQANMRARMDFHTQLLGKFQSGREFTDFLDSQGGRRFVENLWSGRIDPRERLVKSTGAGTAFVVLGLGALIISLRSHGFTVLGIVFLFVGACLLISAAISYRLSKRLGLLEKTAAGANE